MRQPDTSRMNCCRSQLVKIRSKVREMTQLIIICQFSLLYLRKLFYSNFLYNVYKSTISIGTGGTKRNVMLRTGVLSTNQKRIKKIESKDSFSIRTSETCYFCFFSIHIPCQLNFISLFQYIIIKSIVICYPSHISKEQV